MVCLACGTAVAAGVNFCPRCGTQLVAQPGTTAGAPAGQAPQPVYSAPPPYNGMPYGAPVWTPKPRVQGHLQTLGILWLVFAAYRVIGVLFIFFAAKLFASHVFGSDWPFGDNLGDSWARHGGGFLAALVPFIAVLAVASALLAIATGYALLTRKPWGRTLAIVAAVLALFKPLLGTGLGIYTLWALAPAQSGVEWEAIADRS